MPSGVRTSFTSVGSRSSPPFAIAPYATASWMGVTPISYPMASDAADCRDHSVGGRSVPAASEGYCTPVGVPKPKSRSVSYCSAGVSRCANFTMPMLLDQRMTSASESAAALWTSRIVRRSTVKTPFSVFTTSVVRARPRDRSADAVNGLSVDPGSNVSTNAGLPVERGSARRLDMARISPVCGSRMTTSPPDAPVRATASASARSAIS